MTIVLRIYILFNLLCTLRKFSTSNYCVTKRQGLMQIISAWVKVCDATRRLAAMKCLFTMLKKYVCRVWFVTVRQAKMVFYSLVCIRFYNIDCIFPYY